MNNKYLQSEGTFEGVVTEPAGGWMQLAGEKQTPYICIPLEVTGDDVDAGKTITWQGWMTDKSIERTIETLIECFDFNGDLNSLYAGKQTFVGQPVGFTTAMEEYNGKTRWKVKWLNRAGYVHQPKKMDETTAKTLLAGWQKKALAVASNFKRDPEPTMTKAQPKPGLAALKAVVEDDDVPF